MDKSSPFLYSWNVPTSLGMGPQAVATAKQNFAFWNLAALQHHHQQVTANTRLQANFPFSQLSPGGQQLWSGHSTGAPGQIPPWLIGSSPPSADTILLQTSDPSHDKISYFTSQQLQQGIESNQIPTSKKFSFHSVESLTDEKIMQDAEKAPQLLNINSFDKPVDHALRMVMLMNQRSGDTPVLPHGGSATPSSLASTLYHHRKEEIHSTREATFSISKGLLSPTSAALIERVKENLRSRKLDLHTYQCPICARIINEESMSEHLLIEIKLSQTRERKRKENTRTLFLSSSPTSCSSASMGVGIQAPSQQYGSGDDTLITDTSPSALSESSNSLPEFESSRSRYKNFLAVQRNRQSRSNALWKRKRSMAAISHSLPVSASTPTTLPEQSNSSEGYHGNSLNVNRISPMHMSFGATNNSKLNSTSLNEPILSNNASSTTCPSPHPLYTKPIISAPVESRNIEEMDLIAVD